MPGGLPGRLAMVSASVTCGRDLGFAARAASRAFPRWREPAWLPAAPLAASCPVPGPLAGPAQPAVDGRGRGGSRLLPCVFHRACAPGGPAPRLSLLECRVADAGAQPGKDRIVVRDAG